MIVHGETAVRGGPVTGASAPRRRRSGCGCCAAAVVALCAMAGLALGLALGELGPAGLEAWVRQAWAGFQGPAPTVPAGPAPPAPVDLGAPWRGLQVLEEARAPVGLDGAEVALAGGAARVVVPAGAAAAPAEVVVRRVDGSATPGAGGGRTVIEVLGPEGGFAADVEVRLAVDPTAAPDDLLVARVEPETGELVQLPVRLEVAAGRAEAVLAVRHFCLFVLDDLAAWAAGVPAPERVRLEVGRYRQGATPYCWATCLHMLCRAHGATGDGLFPLLGEVAHDQAWYEPRFDTPYALRFRGALAAAVERRVGAPPVRRLWDWGVLSATTNTPLQGPLRRFLRRSLALGRPVVLASQTEGHAWLVVGYEPDDRFVVHDPRDDEGGGYLVRPASKLGVGWATPGRATVTIDLGAGLPESRPRLTLGLPSGAARFCARGADGALVAGWELTWTHTRAQGYAVVEGARRRAAAHTPVGPGHDALVVGDPGEGAATSGLEVVDARLAGSPRPFKVVHGVVEPGSGDLGGHVVEGTVAAGERVAVPLLLELAALRPAPGPDAAPRPLRFVACLVDAEGVVVDRLAFDFELAPAAPEPPPALTLETREENDDPGGQVLVRYSYYPVTAAVPADWPRSRSLGLSGYLPVEVVLHGDAEYFVLPERRLARRERYERGRPTGTWESWAANGTRVRASTWVDGREATHEEWRDDGRPVRRRAWTWEGPTQARIAFEQWDGFGLLEKKGQVRDRGDGSLPEAVGEHEERTSFSPSGRPQDAFCRTVLRGAYDPEGYRTGPWEQVVYDLDGSGRVEATTRFEYAGARGLTSSLEVRHGRDGGREEVELRYEQGKETVVRRAAWNAKGEKVR